MRIRKAVLPVAGLGTRFLPATKAQPKEMLPIVDKPLVQYGVEEVAASGIPMVVFVTGRGKQAIADHADLVKIGGAHGADRAIHEPADRQTNALCREHRLGRLCLVIQFQRPGLFQ